MKKIISILLLLFSVLSFGQNDGWVTCKGGVAIKITDDSNSKYGYYSFLYIYYTPSKTEKNKKGKMITKSGELVTIECEINISTHIISLGNTRVVYDNKVKTKEFDFEVYEVPINSKPFYKDIEDDLVSVIVKNSESKN